MPNTPYVEIKGLEQILANYGAFGERAHAALKVGLREIGEDIMLASKELCPVRYGGLRASGLAHEVMEDADGLVEILSYGDDAVDYAIYVHENLGAYHPVGQAKFLEVPFVEATPDIPARLTETLRALLGL